MNNIIIAICMIMGIGCAISALFIPINIILSVMGFTMAYIVKKEQLK